ncbi:hypothetical protein ACTFIU_010734 [Dictyostelium citrinum]
MHSVGKVNHQNIYFKCKSHLENTQQTFNYILTKCGNQPIKWDIKILNHLEIESTANIIALLIEAIWKRRNKFIHEKEKITPIHKEQIIHELKKTQMAAWGKTKANIDKRIRIMNNDQELNEHKHFQIISKSLQRFNHLKLYITSINTLYQ